MLVAAVDRGSLSAAGRWLRVPVPTLSRKISDLEARLGVRLLIRTTRRLSLTDAGAAYVTAARRILDEVAVAEREAAGEMLAPRGDLVVTAPLLFGRLHVLPVITDFLALYPQINVRLALSDQNAHLIDDHIDMAVRIGALADSAMIATRVGTMRTVTCASPALLARLGTPRTPDELRHLPCVAAGPSSLASGWPYRDPASGAPATIPVMPRLTVSTADAAAEAAVHGVGVTRLLHYQVADAIEAGALRIVLADFELPPAPVSLVHAARGQMPLKMRSFHDFAAPRLRRTLTAFAH